MNSKVTTFYSYKGGSGRSMAIANVAWALASNGERVLAIDWDLEAPGLHRYFHPFLQDPSQDRSTGLMDYLWSYISELTESSSKGCIGITPDYLVQEVEMPVKRAGVLHFIGAGMQDAHYSDRVGALEWGAFYRRFGGEAFLTKFMKWARSHYTHILIDSRTGVADSAGVCTVQLPDAVVMFTVYNRQSIEGTAAVAQSIIRSRKARHMPEADIRVVPSRVEDRSDIMSARSYCEKSLRDVLRSHRNLAKQLRMSEIKHYPWCSFEERLAVFEELPGDSGSLLQAMHRLASQIAERDIHPVEFDSNLLRTYWQRAAFEDPRLAELEMLSSAPDSETVPKLVYWLEEALNDPHQKMEWIGTLGVSCVRQANSLGETGGRVAEHLSEQGFELAKLAYRHDPRGYRARYAYVLQARADFLQRIGRPHEALELTEHAFKLLGTKTPLVTWKRAKALERVAELTLSTRGPTEALPIYERMANELKGLDRTSMPTAAADDSLRSQRLLAEVLVQLGQYDRAFEIVDQALADARYFRDALERTTPEAAHLLRLYAEIGSIIYPDKSTELLAQVKTDAVKLVDSEALSSVLRRNLALVESGALVRRNLMKDALAAVSTLDGSNHSKATASDAQLNETWEAQVKLRLALELYSEAQELLDERIRYNARTPLSSLCELILQYMEYTKDITPLLHLVVKRTSSSNMEPSERKMLNQVLSRARETLGKPKASALLFLQQLLNTEGDTSPPHSES